MEKSFIKLKFFERRWSKTQYSAQIENFLRFLMNCDEKYNIAVQKENDADAATQDILHHIELKENTQQDYILEGLQLHRVRRERRHAKNTQRLTKPIKEWEASNKRVIRDLEKLLGEVRRQERYIENRSYTPKTDVLRILEGGEE